MVQPQQDPLFRLKEMKKQNAPIWEQYAEFENQMINNQGWQQLDDEHRSKVYEANFGFADPKEMFRTPEAALWDEETAQRIGSAYLSGSRLFNQAQDPAMRQQIAQSFFQDLKQYHANVRANKQSSLITEEHIKHIQRAMDKQDREMAKQIASGEPLVPLRPEQVDMPGVDLVDSREMAQRTSTGDISKAIMDGAEKISPGVGKRAHALFGTAVGGAQKATGGGFAFLGEQLGQEWLKEYGQQGSAAGQARYQAFKRGDLDPEKMWQGGFGNTLDLMLEESGPMIMMAAATGGLGPLLGKIGLGEAAGVITSRALSKAPVISKSPWALKHIPALAAKLGDAAPYAAIMRLTEGTMEAGGAFEEALLSGKHPSEAVEIGNAVLAMNTAALGGADMIQTALLFTGMPGGKMLNSLVPKSKLLRMPMRTAWIATKLITAGGMEGMEEVQQEEIQAWAKGEGYDLRTLTDWKHAREKHTAAFNLGALTSGAMSVPLLTMDQAGKEFRGEGFEGPVDNYLGDAVSAGLDQTFGSVSTDSTPAPDTFVAPEPAVDGDDENRGDIGDGGPPGGIDPAVMGYYDGLDSANKGEVLGEARRLWNDSVKEKMDEYGIEPGNLSEFPQNELEDLRRKTFLEALESHKEGAADRLAAEKVAAEEAAAKEKAEKKKRDRANAKGGTMTVKDTKPRVKKAKTLEELDEIEKEWEENGFDSKTMPKTFATKRKQLELEQAAEIPDEDLGIRDLETKPIGELAEDSFVRFTDSDGKVVEGQVRHGLGNEDEVAIEDKSEITYLSSDEEVGVVTEYDKKEDEPAASTEPVELPNFGGTEMTIEDWIEDYELTFGARPSAKELTDYLTGKVKMSPGIGRDPEVVGAELDVTINEVKKAMKAARAARKEAKPIEPVAEEPVAEEPVAEEPVAEEPEDVDVPADFGARRAVDRAEDAFIDAAKESGLTNEQTQRLMDGIDSGKDPADIRREDKDLDKAMSGPVVEAANEYYRELETRNNYDGALDKATEEMVEEEAVEEDVAKDVDKSPQLEVAGVTIKRNTSGSGAPNVADMKKAVRAATTNEELDEIQRIENQAYEDGQIKAHRKSLATMLREKRDKLGREFDATEDVAEDLEVDDAATADEERIHRENMLESMIGSADQNARDTADGLGIGDPNSEIDTIVRAVTLREQFNEAGEDLSYMPDAKKIFDDEKSTIEGLEEIGIDPSDNEAIAQWIKDGRPETKKEAAPAKRRSPMDRAGKKPKAKKKAKPKPKPKEKGRSPVDKGKPEVEPEVESEKEESTTNARQDAPAKLRQDKNGATFLTDLRQIVTAALSNENTEDAISTVEAVSDVYEADVDHGRRRSSTPFERLVNETLDDLYARELRAEKERDEAINKANQERRKAEAAARKKKAEKKRVDEEKLAKTMEETLNASWPWPREDSLEEEYAYFERLGNEDGTLGVEAVEEIKQRWFITNGIRDHIDVGFVKQVLDEIAAINPDINEVREKILDNLTRNELIDENSNLRVFLVQQYPGATTLKEAAGDPADPAVLGFAPPKVAVSIGGSRVSAKKEGREIGKSTPRTAFSRWLELARVAEEDARRGFSAEDVKLKTKKKAGLTINTDDTVSSNAKPVKEQQDEGDESVDEDVVEDLDSLIATGGEVNDTIEEDVNSEIETAKGFSNDELGMAIVFEREGDTESSKTWADVLNKEKLARINDDPNATFPETQEDVLAILNKETQDALDDEVASVIGDWYDDLGIADEIEESADVEAIAESDAEEITRKLEEAEARLEAESAEFTGDIEVEDSSPKKLAHPSGHILTSERIDKRREITQRQLKRLMPTASIEKVRDGDTTVYLAKFPDGKELEFRVAGIRSVLKAMFDSGEISDQKKLHAIAKKLGFTETANVLLSDIADALEALMTTVREGGTHPIPPGFGELSILGQESGGEISGRDIVWVLRGTDESVSMHEVIGHFWLRNYADDKMILDLVERFGSEEDFADAFSLAIKRILSPDSISSGAESSLAGKTLTQKVDALAKDFVNWMKRLLDSITRNRSANARKMMKTPEMIDLVDRILSGEAWQNRQDVINQDKVNSQFEVEELRAVMEKHGGVLPRLREEDTNGQYRPIPGDLPGEKDARKTTRAVRDASDKRINEERQSAKAIRMPEQIPNRPGAMRQDSGTRSMTSTAEADRKVVQQRKRNKWLRRFKQNLSPNRGVDPRLRKLVIQSERTRSSGRYIGQAADMRMKKIVKSLSKKHGGDRVSRSLSMVLDGRMPISQFARIYDLDVDGPQLLSLHHVLDRQAEVRDALSKSPNLSADMRRQILANEFYQTRFYAVHVLGDGYTANREAYQTAVDAMYDAHNDEIDRALMRANEVLGKKDPFDLAKYIKSKHAQRQDMLSGLSKTKRAAIERVARAIIPWSSAIRTIEMRDGGVVATWNEETLENIARYTVDGYLNRAVLRGKETAGPTGGMPITNRMHRTLDKVFRNLYGEITVPGERMARTIEVQNDLMAASVLYQKIFEEGERLWWSESMHGEFTEQLGDGGAYPTPLDRKQYGNLAGKFVNKETYDLLHGTGAFERGPEKAIVSFFQKAQAYTRGTRLLWWKTVVRNYVTSITGFATRSGDILRPTWGKHFLEGNKLAVRIANAIFLGNDPEALEILSDLVERDVFDTTQESITAAVQANLKNINTKEMSGGVALEKMLQFYGVIDLPAKYASYKTALDRGFSEEQAVEHVHRFYQYKDSVPEGVAKLNRLGLGDYFGYTWDSGRITKEQLVHVVERAREGDVVPLIGYMAGMTIPLFRLGTGGAFYQVLTGTGAKIAASGLPQTIMQALGIKDDDDDELFRLGTREEEGALRDSLPSYDRDMPLAIWYTRKSKTDPWTLHWKILGNQSAFPLEDIVLGAWQSGIADPERGFTKALISNLMRAAPFTPGMAIENINTLITGDQSMLDEGYKQKGLQDVARSAYKAWDDDAKVMSNWYEVVAERVGQYAGETVFPGQSYNMIHKSFEVMQDRDPMVGRMLKAKDWDDVFDVALRLTREYDMDKDVQFKRLGQMIENDLESYKEEKYNAGIAGRQDNKYEGGATEYEQFKSERGRENWHHALKSMEKSVSEFKTLTKDNFTEAEIAEYLKTKDIRKDEVIRIIDGTVDEMTAEDFSFEHMPMATQRGEAAMINYFESRSGQPVNYRELHEQLTKDKFIVGEFGQKFIARAKRIRKDWQKNNRR